MATGSTIRSRYSWNLPWYRKCERSRSRTGLKIMKTTPRYRRPTRDEAWMYSAIDFGIPLNTMTLRRSTSTPCETMLVATTPSVGPESVR